MYSFGSYFSRGAAKLSVVSSLASNLLEGLKLFLSEMRGCFSALETLDLLVDASGFEIGFFNRFAFFVGDDSTLIETF
jgi:hypothetical protein